MKLLIVGGSGHVSVTLALAALGGGHDASNLQALCYSCNAMKRDRDSTDFREVRESYEDRQGGAFSVKFLTGVSLCRMSWLTPSGMVFLSLTI